MRNRTLALAAALALGAALAASAPASAHMHMGGGGHFGGGHFGGGHFGHGGHYGWGGFGLGVVDVGGADDDCIRAFQPQRLDLDIAAVGLHLVEAFGQRFGRQILKAADHHIDVALQRLGGDGMQRRRDG